MTEYTNPAKRLYDILNLIMDSQSLAGEHYDSSMYRLVGLLGFGPDVDLDFADSICQIFSLIHSYEQIVNRSESMPEERKGMHLSQLKDVKSFLVGLDDWEQLIEGLDKNLIRSLQWAAGELNYHRDEYVIKEEDLANLQSEIDELTNEIVNSDLDAQLKSVLTGGLNGVRQAILEYRIHGAEGLRQALDKIIADMIRYREEFDAASTKNETQESIRNYFKVIRRVDNLVSTGLKIKQIAGPPIKSILGMLGSGDGD